MEENGDTNPPEIRKKNKDHLPSNDTNLMVDMLVGGGSNMNTRESQLVTVDADTLVAQTQARMWKALKRGYHYGTNLKSAQSFLQSHVNSKIHLIIIYVDLVGSTNMSMTLPVDKLVSIIRTFTYEMSSIIQNHEGYVLKYVGDAIISFFPSGFNKLLACDNVVYCAKSMIRVVRDGINPILNQYDYPELSIKIGIDEGENVIVQYGHDKDSPIDILGYCISIAAKITSITDPNRITIGEDVYEALHPALRTRCRDAKYHSDDWKYTNRQTGEVYKLYSMEN
jgi:adenylate cyclase